MNAEGGGRPGALPPAGYRPRRRVSTETPLQVLFIPEDAEECSRVFDFERLTVSPELQLAFAKGFVQRTKAGGRLRRLGSAEKSYRFFRGFATYLGTLNTPPARPQDLLPVHLDGWRLERLNYTSLWHQVGELISNLRTVPGLGPEFRTALNQRQPEHANRRRGRANSSYSRAENQRILNAARHDVRQAAARIRAGQELADRWRAGDLDGEPPHQRRRGRLAAFVEEHADVPRTPSGGPQWWVRQLGTVAEHVEAVHLSALEIAAFVILLVQMTGENESTITNAPAGHHRPDGHAGGIASAIVELDKPRRGSRRHMDRPLVDLPKWAGSETEAAGPESDRRDRLQSPFGVFMLLHELAEGPRRLLGSDRLLVWWARSGGGGMGPGLRTGAAGNLIRAWSQARRIPADPAPGAGPDAQPPILDVTLGRLRLTYNELNQEPVAHTETTLVNDYLLRNRGNLAEYQRVVAGALAREVAKARTHAAMQVLTAEEVAEAAEHPARVAARHGMDAATLRRLLAAELDTVMTGCVDHDNSPHAPAGQPCRASFMLCLSCPCARAAPHHLPLQILVRDELANRRTSTTPLRWAERFALPHTQLDDLLDRADPHAVAEARDSITPEHRRLAERFLARELDLP
ncbi:hypothetical protein ACI1MP_31040 [Kitasatospora griseola]|uniref:hypothetical protein n=1 Tax=Kitasatospora griseola TaxID=2064 RepID=UPI003855AFC1